MGAGNSRIDERNKNYEAVVKQKRIFAFFIFFSVFFLSIGTVDILLNGEGDYSDYIWFSPFGDDLKSKYYYDNYLSVPIIMFFISVIVWLFHFGNPKKAYIKKIEAIKQVILKYVPFYFDGYDDRNLYIRFGFKFSLDNNFLKRKIHQKDYLTKVKYLSVFTDDFSPHKLFEIPLSKETSKKLPKMDNLKINSRFTDELMFLELFRIIEGYLVSNVDIFMDIKLSEYKSFGTQKSQFTKESLYFFILHNIEESKVKKITAKFDEILKAKSDKKIDEAEYKKQIKSTIKKYAGAKGLHLYKISIQKMVVFSPLAVKELIDRVHRDAKRYYTQIKLFRTKTHERIMEYGDVDEKKMLSYVSFIYFYKIINFFMGLPSGIISARLKDYDLQRIIDDIDHFEESRGIRQIKVNENDSNGKYDDTFARSFMIFYHEYTNNSFNKSVLFELLDNFNPLRTVDYGDSFSFNGFGSYIEESEE